MRSTTYTMSLVNLAPGQRAAIAEAFETLTAECSPGWLMLDTEGADLMIVGSPSAGSWQEHQLVARLIGENELPGPSELGLRSPVSVIGLMNLLEAARRRLAALAPPVRSGLQVKRAVPLPDRHETSFAGSSFAAMPSEAPARPAMAGPGPYAEDGSMPWRAQLDALRKPAPSQTSQFLSHPAPPFAAPVSRGDPALGAWAETALTLYSIMQNSAPVIAEISIASNALVQADFRYRAFSSTAPIEELPAAPRQVTIRTVSPPPDWPPSFALPGQPLDKLLWFVGYNAFDGAPAPWLHPEDRYRLQRWPNFTEIAYQLDHMRMTAMIGNAYMNPRELAGACGAPFDSAQRMINAYSLMGLLQTSPQVSAPPVALSPPPGQEPPAAKAGLFARLRQKFGL
ncbi:hypothetical protein H7F51_10755 [Novosphingobium flavum]|uniref:Uncharacterized protein n=1 Tax=Novosphingobium flavum TaxID=1778672 RepID=A0A7X1FTE0_9SPHN|nr:hypothetical protein [Novosphingobium flavum]MBC2666007.1 hypothetical protein [Novosphingobium flavum]